MAENIIAIKLTVANFIAENVVTVYVNAVNDITVNGINLILLVAIILLQTAYWFTFNGIKTF